MKTFLSLQPETIALDINDMSVRLLVMGKSGKAFQILSLSEVTLKPGIVTDGVIKDQDALASQIRLAYGTAKGKKLTTRYVIASLPEEKSFYQVIQMPVMSDEDLAGAVPFEAENYIPLPIDKVYLDFQKIPGSGSAKSIDVLVNAMPRPIVDSYVSCLKKAGLIPYVMEVESQAILRGLLKKQDENLPVIFVDFGQSKTSVIGYYNGSIRFTASSSISSATITDALAQGLSITRAKAESLKIANGIDANTKKHIEPVVSALAAEIKKYIGFYYSHSSEGKSSGVSVAKIVLCGNGSSLKKLPQFLTDKLRVPVEVAKPTESLPLVGKELPLLRHKVLSFTTAIGLALRGLQEEIV